VLHQDVVRLDRERSTDDRDSWGRRRLARHRHEGLSDDGDRLLEIDETADLKDDHARPASLESLDERPGPASCEGRHPDDTAAASCGGVNPESLRAGEDRRPVRRQ